MAAERITTWLGALIPRVMFPGGWTTAARHAGAEPLWTGRTRAYDESTLRRAADQLDAQGCSKRVAAALWRQVDGAVRAVDEDVIAHTDMFDQALYTKKLAHAAPIGRLGNRLLAATYFGLTTIALPRGPTLFVHTSWHKPAAPLGDALEDLFDDDARLRWWHRNVRLHIVDRGANGDAALAQMWALEVPYLTIGRKGAELWRLRKPTLRNGEGLPFVRRPDRRLDGNEDDGPWEFIAPADPQDPDETRGIRFRSSEHLTAQELLAINALYKSRWPAVENKIKAVQTRGFGRNRTRSLELTTRRGHDGQMARLHEREQALLLELRELQQRPPSKKTSRQMERKEDKIKEARKSKAMKERAAELKHARPVGGSEWLGKWLHLLTDNAIKLALHKSDNPEVRAMDLPRLFDLLLGRAATTCIEHGKLTMWVDTIDCAADRRAQQGLVEVFNKLELRCRGRAVLLRLHEKPTGKSL